MPKEINLGLRMNTFIFTCDYNISVVRCCTADVMDWHRCTSTDLIGVVASSVGAFSVMLKAVSSHGAEVQALILIGRKASTHAHRR